MKQIFYILTLLSTLTILACNKIKNKTKDLADNVVPHFDAYKADTKFNKERFIEFLKIELTPNIKIFTALTMQLVLTPLLVRHERTKSLLF